MPEPLIRALSAFILALLLSQAVRAQPEAAPQRAIDFARDVQPLLARRCYACHGPDEAHRAAGLRLDERAGLFEGRDGFAAPVVPHRLEDSELWLRVTTSEESDRMPPEAAGPPLSASELQVLRAWIEAGAPFSSEHWAFSAPSAVEAPRVKTAGFARDPIDLFVQARLESEGLSPAEPADAASLIRRLSLDLTGLPPSPAEVQAFVADPDPRAYERLVDRLLASPRHAEHFARQWLDLARYADTHGLHLDNYREMWPYRDEVIRAFAENQPYDDFLRAQIAGDLLPRARPEDRIATGFLRAHVTTNEGGSIEEEVRVRNVMDRLDTFGTVFLGLTVGCAACHDHKYDPLTQAEYYGLYAFFNNLDAPAMDENAKAFGPREVVMSPADRERLSAADARIRRAEADITLRLKTRPFPAPEPSRHAGPLWAYSWIRGGVDGAANEDAPLGSEALSEPRNAAAYETQAVGLARQQYRAAAPLPIGPAAEVLVSFEFQASDPPKALFLDLWLFGHNKPAARVLLGAEDALPELATSAESKTLRVPLPKAGAVHRLAFSAKQLGLRPGFALDRITLAQVGGTLLWHAASFRSDARQEPYFLPLLDDAAPEGATLRGDGEIFHFASEGPIFSGERALLRRGSANLHQDFFHLKDKIALRAGDRFVAHVWLDPLDPPKTIQLQFHGDNWEHRVRYGASAHGASARGAANRHRGDLPPTGLWHRIEVPITEVGFRPGDRFDGIAFTQLGGTVRWDLVGLSRAEAPEVWTATDYGLWREQLPLDPTVPDDLKALANKATVSAAEEERLQSYWLRHLHPDTKAALAPLEAELRAAESERKSLFQSFPTTLVMKERAEARPAYRLDRGAYDQPRELAPRGTPKFLPAMPPELPRDRLGLAEWLLLPDHPLTLRVQVNRLWQWVFGQGLVRTSEDFGRQGQPPENLALLDHLVDSYRRDGFDTRKLVRRMVLSATYRQSSKRREALEQRDPEGLLLGRAERRRLDAEVLRDQALALAGLLVERIGGPGVRPPQPKGLWEAVAYVGSNTERFTPDQGPEKVWRRSLYTFWKRTAPPPQFAILDAPSREACVARRERSNTPLQALLLLNDPQFVEAARGFAQRVLKEGGNSDAERLSFAYALATSRPASEDELAALTGLLHTERAAFAGDPEAAEALLRIGELPVADLPKTEIAAWMIVAQALLNSDRVLSRD